MNFSHMNISFAAKCEALLGSKYDATLIRSMHLIKLLMN